MFSRIVLGILAIIIFAWATASVAMTGWIASVHLINSNSKIFDGVLLIPMLGIVVVGVRVAFSYTQEMWEEAITDPETRLE